MLAKLRLNNSSQVKFGAVLNYIQIILTAVYGLVLTPYIISHLGISNYGVYKTITSFTATLVVVDLGIAGTVQRYVADFIAKKEEDKIPNFVAMAFIITAFLSVVLIVIAVIMFLMIDPTYAKTFNSSELSLAKILFCVSGLNILLKFYSNILVGMIGGYNRFVYANGMGILEIVLLIISIVVFLQFSNNPAGIVAIQLILNGVFFLINFVYLKREFNIKIRYTYWDKTLFFDVGKYMFLMFLTSVLNQINSNLDNIIIGAVRGPDLVTVYSVGLLVYGMFTQLANGIAGVMLPTVANALQSENREKNILNIAVRAGRVQFILLGATLVGFACIGKDFIGVWMGSGYEDVYVITLILITPALFVLCSTVFVSVLRAKNLLGFRTAAGVVSTVFNVIVTVVLIRYWSYIGAAIGTALSCVACELILMNLYYSKKLRLPVLKIYAKIIDKIWICLMISGGVLWIVSKYVYGSWAAIIIDIFVFCIIYAITLLLFGLTEDEKRRIPMIRKYVK